MRFAIKKTVFTVLTILIAYNVYTQTAPSHLKYFGFAHIDCGLDDPNDAQATTNYISEIDSFSNIAHMCVEDYADTIISRVNLMNNHCVKVSLAVSNIFLFLADTNGPSGSNYNLYSDYLTRWNTFKNTNAAVLNDSQIISFYVCDEPTWNGVAFGELDAICSLIKADFPNIPISFVEAYTEVNNVQVPTTADWIGFDRYGVYDVSVDSAYLSELAVIKSKRSAPSQKIILIFDAQWYSGFWPAGWQPDTMEHVVQHYYDLAAADTNIVAMAGFTWPGIAPGWLGARSLPQNVINKTIQIGNMIKANYSPCNMTGIDNNENSEEIAVVYPNPTRGAFTITTKEKGCSVVIFNLLGEQLYSSRINSGKSEINLSNQPGGIYFITLKTEQRTINKKLIINR
ncbi:MAG: T9SS type A sorting domain-containing protein [Bacteroidetes bacterium]|nr:MAG: T9SS type A sorting domain-containing protein [Bacteroidota bacterium]